MIFDIVKAFLVGFIAAIPVGPVLIMVVQRTLSKGRAAGLMSGVGGTFADVVFAVVGLFALSIVDEFISQNADMIMIVGGALVVIIGVHMAVSKLHIRKAKASNGALITYALQSFGSALSNPGALVVIMGLLALAHLSAASTNAPLWSLPLAVAAGGMMWWTAVTILVERYVRISEKTLEVVSRVSGVIIAVIGIALIIKGLFGL